MKAKELASQILKLTGVACEISSRLASELSSKISAIILRKKKLNNAILCRNNYPHIRPCGPTDDDMTCACGCSADDVFCG